MYTSFCILTYCLTTKMKSTSLPGLHELEIKTSLRIDLIFQINFRVRMSGRRGYLGKNQGGKENLTKVYLLMVFLGIPVQLRWVHLFQQVQKDVLLGAFYGNAGLSCYIVDQYVYVGRRVILLGYGLQLHMLDCLTRICFTATYVRLPYQDMFYSCICWVVLLGYVLQLYMLGCHTRICFTATYAGLSYLYMFYSYICWIVLLGYVLKLHISGCLSYQDMFYSYICWVVLIRYDLQLHILDCLTRICFAAIYVGLS